MVEAIDVVVERRIGAVVPGFASIGSDLHLLYCFELGELQMHLQRLMVHSLVFRVLVIELLLRVLPLRLLLLDLLEKLPQVLVGHPLIIPAIQWLIVNVVLVA